MDRFYLLFAILAAAWPAYAQPAGQGSPAEAQKIDSATQQFVEKAAIGDTFEIRSSKLALERVKDKEFQDFAQVIIDDHTKTSKELQSIVQSAQGIQMPEGLDAKHKEMLEKLQSEDGGQFSRLYRSQQIDAHKQAVNLFQQYSQTGTHEELREHAAKTLPSLKQHLQMAEALPEQPGAAAAAEQAGGDVAKRSDLQILSELGSDHIFASSLEGTTVYGAGGEEIGEVDQVVLTRDGKIAALVVGVGGFLGLGEKNVAVPFDAIEMKALETDNGQGAAGPVEPNRVVLNGMTREELEAAPSFEAAD